MEFKNLQCFLTHSFIFVDVFLVLHFHNKILLMCRIYLEHADDVLKAVKEIVEEGIPEVATSKDGSSSSWPTLNKYDPPVLVSSSARETLLLFQLMSCLVVH